MERKTLGKLALLVLIVGTAAFGVGALTTPAHAFVNCKIVSCACPQCEFNEHLETPPGQCCPVCVPD